MVDDPKDTNPKPEADIPPEPPQEVPQIPKAPIDGGKLSSVQDRLMGSAADRFQKPSLQPVEHPAPMPPSRGELPKVDPIQKERLEKKETPKEAVPSATPKNSEEAASQKENLRKMTFGATVRPLRTFRGDIEKVVQEKKVSVVSAIAAETERRSRQTEVAKEYKISNKALIITAASGFLLVAALLILAFALVWSREEAPVITPDKLPSAIFVDSHEEYRIDGKTDRTILRELAGIGQSMMGTLGSIVQVYPTITVPATESREEYRRLATAHEFLSALAVKLPGSFTRALEPELTIGFHIFDGNQPFIILKNSFYENTFAGMLQWEATMDVDLDPWFLPAEARAARLANLPTSTSTLSFSTGGFVDRIIKNKEVRVYPRQGAYGLLYGFLDRETLLITTNEFTFAEILRRFQTER